MPLLKNAGQKQIEKIIDDIIFIRCKAGHGAGRSTQQTILEETDKWSFMFYNMGVKPLY